jgi:hypothetical protein
MVAARAKEVGIATPITASKLLFYVGRGSAQLLDDWDAAARPAWAVKSVILAYLGRHEEAKTLRERFGDIGSDEDASGSHVLVNLFEAAILGSDEGTVRALSRRLAPLADRLAPEYGFGFGGCVARYLGDAAAMLGETDKARDHYGQTIEVCTKVGFRPEMALTRLHLAELLLEHYPDEQADAQKHLDFAIEEFRAMKMQPALERALGHKGLLKA